MPIQQFFSYIMARTSYFQWNDDDVHLVLDQHAELDLFNSASSLKQHSAGRHVAPVRHILIPNQPVFALTPLCCVLSGKAINTNFIVFCLNRPGLQERSDCQKTIFKSSHGNKQVCKVLKNSYLNNFKTMDKTYVMKGHYLEPKICRHRNISKN